MLNKAIWCFFDKREKNIYIFAEIDKKGIDEGCNLWYIKGVM